ncbi:hypothetical protein ACFL1Q_03230 [Patescibacteria group bacterium]
MRKEIDINTVVLGINLDRGDLLVGLGDGKGLYISSSGEVKKYGRRELPDFAYLMFPLVARVVPKDFEGPGDFTKIMELEDKFGEYYGSAEEVYRKVGPALVQAGIPAERLAKTFMDMSPVRIAFGGKDIGEDAYNGYKIVLAHIISQYYPGPAAAKRRRERSIREGKVPVKKYKKSNRIPF